MHAATRIVATIALGYVCLVGYSLFANSSHWVFVIGFLLAAAAGCLSAFFGGDIAELFDLPPVDTSTRSLGVLLLLVLSFVAFTQQNA